MIISQAHDFGFVHIAKCAGSTIRQQLRDKDDLGQRFYRSMTHPDLGHINANHLSLDVLARYFPDEFAALRAVTSYTVVRAPMDRFISGISQFIRDSDREPGDLSEDQIRQTARNVITYMEALSGPPDYAHTLFIPQVNYVTLGEEQIIDHIYPMEALDRLFDRMEQVHGLTLVRDKVWNPTVTYRLGATARPLKIAKDVAQSVLPMGAYIRLRDLAIGVFTTRGVPKMQQALEADSAVKAFVRDYYAEDTRLHDAALNDHGSSRSDR